MDLFKTFNNSKSETAFADPVFFVSMGGVDWDGLGVQRDDFICLGRGEGVETYVHSESMDYPKMD